MRLVNGFSGLVMGTTLLLGIETIMPAIATAPQPPQLVPARLNGQPISVLYMTRAGDKVLVRCYPGQQPSVDVRTRADGVKEGVLTCGN